MKNLTFTLSLIAMLSVNTSLPMKAVQTTTKKDTFSAISLSMLVTVAMEEIDSNKENTNDSKCTLCNKTPDQGCKRTQCYKPF